MVSCKLKRGDRIVEDNICSELGVSKSPLREALWTLGGEGLVSILPRRGALVTDLSQKDLMELFDLLHPHTGEWPRRLCDQELGTTPWSCANRGSAWAGSAHIPTRSAPAVAPATVGPPGPPHRTGSR